MNLLDKLERRERKLVEELEQLRYEMKLAGAGNPFERRYQMIRRSRRRGMVWITCSNCGQDTRADVATCDWCLKPCRKMD